MQDVKLIYCQMLHFCLYPHSSGMIYHSSCSGRKVALWVEVLYNIRDIAEWYLRIIAAMTLGGTGR